MNKFYVYAHLLPDGTPFYIGKGSGKRIISKTGRSIWWNRVVLKHYGKNFPNHTILIENISSKQALTEEIKFIKRYGRRDKKEGLLINLTDGGDGANGHTHSRQSKLLMSKQKKGIKFTNSHKQKLSESAKTRSKTFQNLTDFKIILMSNVKRKFVEAVLRNKITNEIVTITNVSKFSNQYKLHQGHISEVIHGSRKSHNGWILITMRK